MCLRHQDGVDAGERGRTAPVPKGAADRAHDERGGWDRVVRSSRCGWCYRTAAAPFQASGNDLQNSGWAQKVLHDPVKNEIRILMLEDSDGRRSGSTRVASGQPCFSIEHVDTKPAFVRALSKRV
jgi:hypothetical protein